MRLSLRATVTLWAALSGLVVGLGMAAGIGWFPSGAAGLLVALLGGALTAAPVRRLGLRARALASGASLPRRGRSGLKDIEEAEVSLVRLAARLAQADLGLEEERRRATAVLDALLDGVALVDEDGTFVQMNRAARRLLRVPESAVGAVAGSAVREPALRDVLSRAASESVAVVEVTLERSVLQVDARPLPAGGGIVTIHDVTELRRLEAVRRDFVANASHELKTPLTVIRGFAEAMLDDEPSPDVKRTFLESMRRQSLRMQSLVDDLLDLSRLESGGWVSAPSKASVAAIAGSAWDEGGAATAERPRFTVEGDADAWVDTSGLTQVFRNLFDNAVRYTPGSGCVTVRVAEEAGMVRVAVTDDGVGIPSEALPRIFERFYRVDPARSREAGGTGLGLSIVAHLIQAMGGEVSATSGVGQGTTVSFSVPSAATVEGERIDLQPTP